MKADRLYLLLSAALFELVGVFQAVRAALAWPLMINDYAVPVAFSYVAAVLMITFGAWGFMVWRRG